VLTTRSHLATAPWVVVDVREVEELASRLTHEPDASPLNDSAVRAFASDLLPDWYDEWVIVERDRFRELRLHALIALCAKLVDLGRWSRAIEAGQAAIAADPLRESGWSALIRAHFAEGNIGEAFRLHQSYQRRVIEELGVEPSQGFRDLIVLISGGA
jgi:DNA-binding SARP family transcriptional activator